MTQYIVKFDDGSMQMTDNYGEYLALKGFAGKPVDSDVVWFVIKVMVIPFLIFLLICGLIA